MPGLGGHELAAQAVLHRPNLKVLFTSGYSSDSGLRLDVLSAAVQFIESLPIDELTHAVREVSTDDDVCMALARSAQCRARDPTSTAVRRTYDREQPVVANEARPNAP
jgi:hypothetical protein